MGKIQRLQVNNMGNCKLLSCRGMFTSGRMNKEASQGKREQERTEVELQGCFMEKMAFEVYLEKEMAFFVVV